MKKFLLFFFVLFVFIGTSNVHAQERTVTGKVTSVDDGAALPGVNVVLKGTSTGTVTDIDGNYTISIPSGNATLVFSFIGLTSEEVEIGSRSIVDLQMTSDVTQLSEVVVVGYGQTEKKKLTGAVETVTAEKFEQVPVPSFENILQGNVAGLNVQSTSGQPGGATNVRLRGIGSINAGSAPLYVLDGVPINIGDLTRAAETSNVLASLNPNDIESLTVLKDASAAAIYGSRAANGVILITTKRGKPGKTKFNFRTQHGVSSRGDDSFDVMTASQFTEYMREAVVNSGGDPDDPTSAGTYFPIVADTVDTDWLDLAFQDGSLQSYELNASGGDEKTRFFASVAYLDQEGIAVQTALERLSTRFNIDHSANDKLTFGINAGISNAKQLSRYGAGTSFGDPLYGGMFLSPLYPVFASEEQIAAGDDRGTGFNFNTPGFANHNIVATQALSSNETNTFRITGKIYMNYDILPGLTFNNSLGLDMVRLTEEEWTSQNHTDGVNDGGVVQVVATQNADYVLTNTLNYTKTFSDVHNLSILIGNEYQNAIRESVDVEGNNFPSDKLRTVNSAAIAGDFGAFGTEWAIWGLFSRLNYNYANKYFFDASLRRDGSSRFGANKRFATFWSVGGGYSISEEPFMDNISAITNLKLRSSYGTSGNQDINNFESRGLYQFGSYHGQPTSRPTQLDNPDLTWEESVQFNVGLDFSLFSDRLSGTVDYYNRTTSEMLLDVGISRTSGFGEITQNRGEMVNKGWEVTLNSVNAVLGDFTWGTSFNIAFNDNEITELPGGEDIVDGNTILREGEAVNAWFLPIYAGVNPADGAPMWYDEDGNIVFAYGDADRQIVGQPFADFFGGLTNTFEYKGLSLSVFFFFNQGNDVRRTVSQFINSDGSRFGRNQSTEQLRRWQQPGDITDVPIIKRNNTDQGNSASTRQLHDGSFIRLRNVTLAYNLPQSLVSKARLSNVRVYAQGQNLLTWTKYPGLDPETGIQGVDFGLYPQPRAWTVGIDIGF
ncbi:MAG: TonB-dependent receptor [Bacteroidota bacterium]